MSSEKLERLLVLLMTLLETERPLRVEEIRERVPGYPDKEESFRRQFERDKDDLRELGAQLSYEPIPGAEPGAGGYRLRPEDYYLADPGLEPDELAALHLATRLVRLGEDQGLDALRPLGGLPSIPAVPGVQDPIVALPTDPHLESLFTAVVERREVSFVYRGEERTVEPHRLEFQRGWWYLTGRDKSRDAPRAFRLDRMEGTVDLGDPGGFERPAEPAPSPTTTGWELREDEPVTARLLVDASLAWYATRSLGEACVAERLPDGAVVVEVQVTHRSAFRSFVLSLLDHATVLDPPELVEDVVVWLEALVASNGEGAEGVNGADLAGRGDTR